MKKVLAIVFIILVLVSSTASASAATKDAAELMYTYINSVGASLTIDETLGIATCSGRVNAKSIVPVKVTVRLQRYQDGSWKNVETWSETGTAGVTCTKYYAIYSGYSYRVYVTGYVYDSEGVIQETASVYDYADFS